MKYFLRKVEPLIDVASLLMGGWILNTLGRKMVAGESIIASSIGFFLTLYLLIKLFQKYLD